ncbi:MAG: hypothetical protein HOE19_03490 [Candidatus Komeilibacteria bacterium]|nr:hypothetical protein [Candidatus Komeilibacteria bacterium]MBT4447740.1 hypothetical protein [Candidatus Komeilibacteria bacterium]
MAFGLESEGHEVLTNIETNESGGHHAELNTTKVIRKMLEWKPVPDVIIIECLEVDSERFMSILQGAGMQHLTVLAMSHRYKNNTRLQRLMSEYGAFCMPKPLNVNNLVEYVQELSTSPVG